MLKTGLAVGVVLASLLSCASAAPIDRHALVTRHNITWNDPSGRMALGNGEFCFGTDGTGLQTFSGNSMSHWGWHSFPLPEGVTPDQVPATGSVQTKVVIQGDNFPGSMRPITDWMWNNPHILNLGRLRLVRGDGRTLSPGDIVDLERTVDLWSGLQVSKYKIDGQPVRVETCVHPALDMVAVRIESPLVAKGELKVVLDFGYPALDNGSWLGDFSRTEGTTTLRRSSQRIDLKRTIDATVYNATLSVSKGGAIREPLSAGTTGKLTIKRAEYGAGDKWADVTDKVRAAAAEDSISLIVNNDTMGIDPTLQVTKSLRVTYAIGGKEAKIEIPESKEWRIPADAGPEQGYIASGNGSQTLEITCAYSTKSLPATLPSCAETKVACAAHWQKFWKTGGAIDLSGSKDPRWKELERRIVLSQYQMAVQSAGSWPSSESGLMGLDMWRGQFHMEMVWWHLAHYYLWNRSEMADEAIGCYQRFEPMARKLAAQVGLKGLKWGKMVGPEGRTAPWVGSLVLLWKEPHPIFFAELDYRLHPTQATLKKWANIVQGTAEQMVGVPTLDEKTGVYHLAACLVPSEEAFTSDSSFDLAYWRWGLEKAQEWRKRMGLPRITQWDEVRTHLAPIPVDNGVFVRSPQQDYNATFMGKPVSHPDQIGLFGMLPSIDVVDPKIAHSTLIKTWEMWRWPACWGWDYPWMAMSAARTGEPGIAIDALLKDCGQNAYDQQGLNNGGASPYLPGNGGLLYAAAMMAAGWDGCPKRHAPGFPSDGSWVVKWEGLKPAL